MDVEDFSEDWDFPSLEEGIEISIKISECTSIETHIAWEYDNTFTIFKGDIVTSCPLFKKILEYKTDIWMAICETVIESKEGKEFQSRINAVIQRANKPS